MPPPCVQGTVHPPVCQSDAVGTPGQALPAQAAVELLLATDALERAPTPLRLNKATR
jgi:hypothetical protein